MYPTYDANKISSLGTPYALADSYAGYGECAKKIQARSWSPSTSEGNPVVVSQIESQPIYETPFMPYANIRNYPLVLEKFTQPPQDVSCGMYACAPGVIPRFATIPVPDETIKEGFNMDTSDICSQSSACRNRRIMSNILIISFFIALFAFIAMMKK